MIDKINHKLLLFTYFEGSLLCGLFFSIFRISPLKKHVKFKHGGEFSGIIIAENKYEYFLLSNRIYDDKRDLNEIKRWHNQFLGMPYNCAYEEQYVKKISLPELIKIYEESGYIIITSMHKWDYFKYFLKWKKGF
jgi:hypothetical protein